MSPQFDVSQPLAAIDAAASLLDRHAAIPPSIDRDAPQAELTECIASHSHANQASPPSTLSRVMLCHTYLVLALLIRGRGVQQVVHGGTELTRPGFIGGGACVCCGGWVSQFLLID